MARIFLFNVMLWTYSSCLAEQPIASDFYKLLNENESISNHFPFRVENTTSEIECLLKGQRQTMQTCFIQTEKMGEGVGWQCSFFNAIEKTGLEQQTKMNGKIYVLSKNKDECFNLIPRDCSQWYRNSYRKSGIYKIKNNNVIKEVYCHMNDTSPGWTFFQRRINGTVSFNRNWEEYKNGFGTSSGEYWLGNEFLHQLTKGSSTVEARFTATSFSNEKEMVIVKGFWIDSEPTSINYIWVCMCLVKNLCLMILSTTTM